MIFRIIRNIALYFIIRRVLGLLFLLAVAAYFMHGGFGSGGSILGGAWHSATRGLASVVSAVHAAPAPQDRYGHSSGPAPASHPLSGRSSVSVGFSPGSAEPLVVQAIDQATLSIDVAAYSFTSRPISTALTRAAARGVTVRVVMDKSQRSEGYSKATFLTRAGIPVRIDDRYAIMHNKFMVIDGATVETGSFNFTASAAVRNAENVLVLHDAPRVAGRYEGEWQRLWGESTAFVGRD